MPVRYFVPVLPSIEVESIDSDYDLKRLRDDMKRDASSYVGTSKHGVRNLTLGKRGLWEFSDEYEDGKQVRDYVISIGDIVVTSENGRKYAGPNQGELSGNFSEIPIELFHPIAFSKASNNDSF